MPSTRFQVRTALGAIALLAAQHAAAFGDAGYLPSCASFTTCTAALASGASYEVRYEVTAISASYDMPWDLRPGITRYNDFSTISTPDALRVTRLPPPPPPPFVTSPFFLAATAQAQSDFAINRAASRPDRGAVGVDIQANASADVKITTFASASSAWRDVWAFSADGHLSANVSVDGGASVAALSTFQPSFHTNAISGVGDWFYELRVWDVTHLSVSSDFELGGPTPVTRVKLGRSDEERASFALTGALSFDYEVNTSYVITAELRSTSDNGLLLDLFNTARLGPVQLSGGSQLTALSGHDYTAAVPELSPAGLWLAGLVLTTACAARRRR